MIEKLVRLIHVINNTRNLIDYCFNYNTAFTHMINALLTFSNVCVFHIVRKYEQKPKVTV